MTIALRTFSVLCLLLAITACATPEPSHAESAAWRSWHYDDGTTRSLRLTVFDNDIAELFARGPAVSVPHWGELDYPENQAFARIQRVGGRTFLIFAAEGRLAEIAERSGDHLAVWFRDFSSGEDIAGQLHALPINTRTPDLELLLVPEPASKRPEVLPEPTNRFSI